jgi:lysophospholipase L1-like esterase
MMNLAKIQNLLFLPKRCRLETYRKLLFFRFINTLFFMRMRFVAFLIFAVAMVMNDLPASAQAQVSFFGPSHPDIVYTGRIDFTNPQLPRFWQGGVYITAKFSGSFCSVLLEDEVLWGKSHNYVTIVIDGGKPLRIRLKEKTNTINVGKTFNLSEGDHTIIITKDTEAGVGYLEFKGLVCKSLLPLSANAGRKLEFIGDSITAGMENDLAEIPCDQGEWFDQHNAWLSYGPLTARSLSAQWHLSAVSGIGLIHSCCGMKITMPQVYDKINQRKDTLLWDFKRYQPDAVTICLGQNDGVQDSVQFCSAYINFINTVRKKYPDASIVCLSSPMANARLTKVLKNYLTAVVQQVNTKGDRKVSKFFFSKSFNNGCGGHPDLADHQQIASELTAYLRSFLQW